MNVQYCGSVNEKFLEQTVTVRGWVHRRRDHGGVIFLDVRDRYGLVQVVVNPDNQDAFALADSVRSEYVIVATGLVRNRPDGNVNPDLPTGQVEIKCDELQVLNTAETPPFPIDEHVEVGEIARLQHRYIDLRKSEHQQKLIFRSKLTRALRRYLDDHNFLDIETPVLTKATPEGARDYLVPSRTHQGMYFALPQSPQIFKQLLMMSGFDRYYQIVRCFRDEDLRADRQPEFTQVDIETTFLDETEIMAMMEQMVAGLFRELLDVELSEFPVMTFHEAMANFGTDRPDLRNPLRLLEISDLVGEVDFKVFADPAKDPEGKVVCLRLPEGNKLSRKQLDDYGKFVGRFGAKGLAYIKVNDLSAGMEGLQSPILKFLTEDVVQAILARIGAATGDVLFFGADTQKIVYDALGALRDKLGVDCDLLADGFHPVWVVDFPMFERDIEVPRGHANFSKLSDEERRGPRVVSLHHPFTAPKVDSPEQLLEQPLQALSRAYDMVINGCEVGGGSIRIHTREMQQAVFALLHIDEARSEEKFGHLLEALRYGCPPHGGIAFGLDRLAMLMTGSTSIREVIAFPKTQSAACPLTKAPSAVDDEQLQELGIRAIKRETPRNND